MDKNETNKTNSASKIVDKALARLSRVKTPLSVDSATKELAFEPQISASKFAQ